jgi:hypothetical protein
MRFPGDDPTIIYQGLNYDIFTYLGDALVSAKRRAANSGFSFYVCPVTVGWVVRSDESDAFGSPSICLWAHPDGVAEDPLAQSYSGVERGRSKASARRTLGLKEK